MPGFSFTICLLLFSQVVLSVCFVCGHTRVPCLFGNFALCLPFSMLVYAIRILCMHLSVLLWGAWSGPNMGLGGRQSESITDFAGFFAELFCGTTAANALLDLGIK